jgi:hypothetical protein
MAGHLGGGCVPWSQHGTPSTSPTLDQGSNGIEPDQWLVSQQHDGSAKTPPTTRRQCGQSQAERVGDAETWIVVRDGNQSALLDQGAELGVLSRHHRPSVCDKVGSLGVSHHVHYMRQHWLSPERGHQLGAAEPLRLARSEYESADPVYLARSGARGMPLTRKVTGRFTGRAPYSRCSKGLTRLRSGSKVLVPRSHLGV